MAYRISTNYQQKHNNTRNKYGCKSHADQSTNKTFSISPFTPYGTTTIHKGLACDNCTQNTPPHPAETFPNAKLPAGPGLVLRPPNKVGAWDMRAFTFAPNQIVVNQGDTVTLHFLGVQGPHHVITVEGVGTFPLDRGHIHTVSFTADKPGTIKYHSHVPSSEHGWRDIGYS